jgi:hypothetical protein
MGGGVFLALPALPSVVKLCIVLVSTLESMKTIMVLLEVPLLITHNPFFLQLIHFNLFPKKIKNKK